MRLLALSLLLTACTTVEPSPSPRGECNAAPLADLVGRPSSAELGAEALRRSGASRLRWIRPGDVVTMDYSPQRLNIHLDSQGRVDHFACG